MIIEIVYCAQCNYEPQAVSLADHLTKTFKAQLKQVVLVPDSGGKFEVSADGKLLFSRLKARRFPENTEMAEAIEKALAS